MNQASVESRKEMTNKLPQHQCCNTVINTRRSHNTKHVLFLFIKSKIEK